MNEDDLLISFTVGNPLWAIQASAVLKVLCFCRKNGYGNSLHIVSQMRLPLSNGDLLFTLVPCYFSLISPVNLDDKVNISTFKCGVRFRRGLEKQGEKFPEPSSSPQVPSQMYYLRSCLSPTKRDVAFSMRCGPRATGSAGMDNSARLKTTMI